MSGEAVAQSRLSDAELQEAIVRGEVASIRDVLLDLQRTRAQVEAAWAVWSGVMGGAS